MNRFAALFAVLLIGSAALPAAAEAQARGCPSGPAGAACRAAGQASGGGDRGGDRGGGRGGDRGGRDDRGDAGAARARPPGRGDEGGPSERSRPPGRGGNSLGDGWSPREADARDGVRGGRLVPLEQVIRRIAGMTPGQLLDAGLENRGDRPIYRVRWQTNDGRRIDYIVDAQTGQIIGRN